MKYLNKCPICDQQDIETIYSDLTDRLYDQNTENFSLQNCPGCGNTYTNPQVEYSEFGKFYPTDNYVPYLQHAIKKHQVFSKLLYDGLSKIFINKFWGTISPGLRMLEIGCSNGDFLLKCKNKGMSVLGIEPDNNAAQRAIKRGLEVLPLSFEEAYPHIKNQKFDVIFMSHVFEHIQNPKTVMKLLASLLSDNGKIIIVVPNINSFNHKLFGKNWMSLDVPRHYFHYSPASLEYMANISDLSVDKTRFVSGPTSFLNSIRYRLNVKNFKIHNKYLLKTIVLPIVVVLNALKKGDEIAVLMQKK